MTGGPIDRGLERKLRRAATAAKAQTATRDRLISEAYTAGTGLREIARAVDMSHAGVRRILVRDGKM